MSENTYHGMRMGDYLEFMVLYAVAHKLGDDVEHHHEFMNKLRTLRDSYSLPILHACIADFHKTRRQYDKTYTPRHEAVALG